MANFDKTAPDKLPLAEQLTLTLDDLVMASAWDKAWVMALIDENIISPETAEDKDVANQPNPLDTLYFNSVQLTQVRRASRLRRDFDASPQAIGLILSLLEELRPLRQLQRQQQAIRVIYEVE